MRRKLFLLVVCLSLCGTMLAQNWTPVSGLQYPTIFIGQVSINGTLQNSDDIEIAAFVGDQVRAAGRLQTFSQMPGLYFAWLTIKYNNVNETVTFKIYDHANEVLYTTYAATLSGEPISIVTGENIYGTPTDPVILAFVPAITKDITGYGTNEGGYYLIASPVGEIIPSAANGFLTNNYDLYYFDQAQEYEWRNYKKGGGFNLVTGMGYLYASQNDTQLTFTGAVYSGDGKVTLSKTSNASVNFQGWNLVGNPFAQTAYIDRPFYRMNDDGTEINSDPGTGGIAAMEGVFVIASENNEDMTFSTTAPSKAGEQMVVNLSQNRGTTIDRAIIGFGEGDVLPKFMLNENNTKLYIPQGNEDYAMVCSAAQGELPLNFRAGKNGTYTLNIDIENIEMNYLHLVDNMTGMDVDMLQNPSYTFEATTRDYESRFKLVFAGTSTSSMTNDSFAFFNNGNWIIDNEGEAILQVFDVEGRILSSEEINGSVSKRIEAARGVYMLRLVNGSDVKVQKIVVE